MDYACGYGFLIELLNKEGYNNVDGVEISKSRRNIIKQRQGNLYRIQKFNLIVGDNIPREMEKKYDLITMFHLIEHISKPIEFMQKVRDLLKDGGLIVIELPNVDNWVMDVSKEFNDFFYIRHYFTGFKQHKIVDLPACIVISGSFRHFLAS